MHSIDEVLQYAHGLAGKPYKWWEGETILGIEDVFYACNGPPPSLSNIHNVNCAGLVNLIVRKCGVPVPGVSLHNEYAGTTSAWFNYLRDKGVLISLEVSPEKTVSLNAERF